MKLKEKLHQVQKQNRGLRKSMSCQEKKLSKLFAPDQRKALRRRGTKGLLWSAHTVKKALQLRFACGASGYDLLLKNLQPLPSDENHLFQARYPWAGVSVSEIESPRDEK